MLERYDENLILGFVENELEPSQRRMVQAWMDQDDHLRGLVEQLMADRKALRQIPVEQAPPQLLESVTQALERKMLLDGSQAPKQISDAASTGGSFKITRWLAYSGVAALLLLSGSLLVHVVNLSLQVNDKLGVAANEAAPELLAQMTRDERIKFLQAQQKKQLDEQRKAAGSGLAGNKVALAESANQVKKNGLRAKGADAATDTKTQLAMADRIAKLNKELPGESSITLDRLEEGQNKQYALLYSKKRANRQLEEGKKRAGTEVDQVASAAQARAGRGPAQFGNQAGAKSVADDEVATDPSRQRGQTAKANSIANRNEAKEAAGKTAKADNTAGAGNGSGAGGGVANPGGADFKDGGPLRVAVRSIDQNGSLEDLAGWARNNGAVFVSDQQVALGKSGYYYRQAVELKKDADSPATGARKPEALALGGQQQGQGQSRSRRQASPDAKAEAERADATKQPTAQEKRQPVKRKKAVDPAKSQANPVADARPPSPAAPAAGASAPPSATRSAPRPAPKTARSTAGRELAKDAGKQLAQADKSAPESKRLQSVPAISKAHKKQLGGKAADQKTENLAREDGLKGRTTKQIYLQVRSDQIPSLIAYLNRRTGQEAQLHGTAQASLQSASTASNKNTSGPNDAVEKITKKLEADRDKNATSPTKADRPAVVTKQPADSARKADAVATPKTALKTKSTAKNTAKSRGNSAPRGDAKSAFKAAEKSKADPTGKDLDTSANKKSLASGSFGAQTQKQKGDQQAPEPKGPAVLLEKVDWARIMNQQLPVYESPSDHKAQARFTILPITIVISDKASVRQSALRRLLDTEAKLKKGASEKARR